MQQVRKVPIHRLQDETKLVAWCNEWREAMKSFELSVRVRYYQNYS